MRRAGPGGLDWSGALTGVPLRSDATPDSLGDGSQVGAGSAAPTDCGCAPGSASVASSTNNQRTWGRAGPGGRRGRVAGARDVSAGPMDSQKAGARRGTEPTTQPRRGSEWALKGPAVFGGERSGSAWNDKEGIAGAEGYTREGPFANARLGSSLGPHKQPKEGRCQPRREGRGHPARGQVDDRPYSVSSAAQFLRRHIPLAAEVVRESGEGRKDGSDVRRGNPSMDSRRPAVTVRPASDYPSVDRKATSIIGSPVLASLEDLYDCFTECPWCAFFPIPLWEYCCSECGRTTETEDPTPSGSEECAAVTVYDPITTDAPSSTDRLECNRPVSYTVGGVEYSVSGLTGKVSGPRDVYTRLPPSLRAVYESGRYPFDASILTAGRRPGTYEENLRWAYFQPGGNGTCADGYREGDADSAWVAIGMLPYIVFEISVTMRVPDCAGIEEEVPHVRLKYRAGMINNVAVIDGSGSWTSDYSRRVAQMMTLVEYVTATVRTRDAAGDGVAIERVYPCSEDYGHYSTAATSMGGGFVTQPSTNAFDSAGLATSVLGAAARGMCEVLVLDAEDDPDWFENALRSGFAAVFGRGVEIGLTVAVRVGDGSLTTVSLRRCFTFDDVLLADDFLVNHYSPLRFSGDSSFFQDFDSQNLSRATSR